MSLNPLQAQTLSQSLWHFQAPSTVDSSFMTNRGQGASGHLIDSTTSPVKIANPYPFFNPLTEALSPDGNVSVVILNRQSLFAFPESHSPDNPQTLHQKSGTL
ncbi:uncharacterized protein CLUP02_05941 [Colletotrichum lupini]|uniref:Uncharacterized protein n=1 Tax=Colletotrichum lupini TaxID=145971 RepID=A0A9Q8SNE9_9PEZI|nr:uncharacterized protein CLUP02_05941 [Colletotrichum lupini]UQC80458.1 hypothetical protein CLUP02_05941 [Colletotrichum lupini]